MHAVDIAGLSKVTTVTASVTSVSLLSPNINRRGLLVYNNGNVEMFIKYGSGALATSFTGRIDPGNLWEMPRPIFIGQVSAIWAAGATGDAQVTELS